MIPDEAVEEAARVIWAETTADRWTYPSDEERRAHTNLARRALEAAAPHLMAQSWDEGFTVGDGYYHTGDETNPYRSQA